MKKITVVMPDKQGTIDRNIYGQFIEHLGGVIYGGLWVGKDSPIPNERGFRKDALDAMRRLDIPVMRWPGGCFAEMYRWRDGIGENRPTRIGFWTGSDKKFECNEVGTHEFFDLCELIGAKPYLALNISSITALDGADWLEYCLAKRGSTTLALEREKNGHPEPFSGEYVGVGNENWGCGGEMSPEYYAELYKKYTSIIRIACQGTSGYPDLFVCGANGDDYKWTRGISAKLENTVVTKFDGMSIHYYVGTEYEESHVKFGKQEWDKSMVLACGIEDAIIRHDASTRSYGLNDRLKLVVDEWGFWGAKSGIPEYDSNHLERQSTMRDAVVTALTFNIFNNHCDKIRMANVAQTCNCLHALFLCDGGENFILTPTFHVFEMYKAHMGATKLRTLITNNDDLAESVSVSSSEKDGKVTVTLANLSFENSAEIDLSFLGADSGVTFDSADLLWCDDPQSFNSFEEKDKVKPTTVEVDITKPFTLPKASVMRISVNL